MQLWWGVFPCFAALVIRLTMERACADPYELLPALSSRPWFAWPIALVYVLAHAWIVGVYLVTVAETNAIVPAWSDWRAIWAGGTRKLLLMLAVFAIEYAPIAVWRVVGEALQCAP